MQRCYDIALAVEQATASWRLHVLAPRLRGSGTHIRPGRGAWGWRLELPPQDLLALLDAQVL